MGDRLSANQVSLLVVCTGENIVSNILFAGACLAQQDRRRCKEYIILDPKSLIVI